jgi:hypothetical protein
LIASPLRRRRVDGPDERNQPSRDFDDSTRCALAIRPCDTHAFARELLADDLRAQRALSVGNGVVGVIHAAALSIHAIGSGLAQAAGMSSKHSIKQVGRLLSKDGFDVWALFAPWVEFVLACRTEVIVALDLTEFDKDDHTTIALLLGDDARPRDAAAVDDAPQVRAARQPQRVRRRAPRAVSARSFPSKASKISDRDRLLGQL